MRTIKIKERNIKTSKLLQLCKDKFPVYSYYSDKELDKQFPIPKILTEREFQDSVEPDPETLGKSTKEADPEMKGITLRERIIMELEYFERTGKHLDIKGITFCSGSRNSDGDVPDACLGDGGRFEVDYVGIGNSDSGYGIRSAVNLLPSYLLTLDEAIKICKDNGLKVTRLKTIEEEL